MFFYSKTNFSRLYFLLLGVLICFYSEWASASRLQQTCSDSLNRTINNARVIKLSNNSANGETLVLLYSQVYNQFTVTLRNYHETEGWYMYDILRSALLTGNAVNICTIFPPDNLLGVELS